MKSLAELLAEKAELKIKFDAAQASAQTYRQQMEAVQNEIARADNTVVENFIKCFGSSGPCFDSLNAT